MFLPNGAFNTFYPPKSVHGGHGLKETNPIAPQVLLTELTIRTSWITLHQAAESYHPKKVKNSALAGRCSK